MAADPDESQNLVDARSDEAQGLERLVRTMSGPELGSTAAVAKDAESVRRLGALGYVAGGARPPADRPDPKDRRAEAMRLAQVTSGELQGDALLAALRAIVADDPASPQANLRLGFALAERQDCAAALARFDVAIRAGMPSADPYLGRASCELASGRTDAARSTLERAIAVEPGNPVVEANLGLIESAANRHEAAAKWLAQAVVTDPDFHEARFNLALTYARQGARQKALDEARELLRRLPADAPERGEVNRLIAALTGPGR
jgi:tetratricopeptide (TPR) repeat protein